jgi:hypothetical protein
MFDGSDTIVLYEELAYEDNLPLTWMPFAAPPEAALLGGFAERNLRVLQASAAIEEHVGDKRPDDNAPNSADLQRLEFKVNLLLDLVGQLLATNQRRPPAVPVQFNALGVAWRAAAPLPAKGERGYVEIYLRESLVEPLRLPGQVASVDVDGRVKVRFDPLEETVADLIEKLAFRRHRRRIASARNPRRT